MKIKIIFSLILIMLISTSVLSQGRATELRKEKLKEQIESEIYDKDDTDFDITVEPEKWKEESAVILCQKRDYKYRTSRSTPAIYTESLRKRIKINDKAAINEFSVFYFRHAKNEKELFNLRLIKPDGSESEIDIEKAVEVAGNEVPEYYKNKNTLSYKKIAIPNLEIGDIVDYYYYSELNVQYNHYCFDPFIFTLPSKYPIVKQKHTIVMEKQFSINFRSFNGANEIIEIPDEENNSKIYYLEDSDREKTKREYWKYYFLEDPTIKFEVSLGGKSTALMFIQYYQKQEEGVINKELDLNKVREEFDDYQTPLSYAILAAKKVKSMHKGEKDPVILAENGYYYLRYEFFNSLYTYHGKDDYLDAEESFLKNSIFIASFKQILEILKVDYKSVVAVKREFGEFENILLKYEMVQGIKVQDKYFFGLSNFSTHDIIPYNLLGSVAFEYTNPDSKIIGSYIPDGDCSDNISKFDINSTISKNFTTINFTRTNTFTGLSKSSYTPVALYKTDYFENDKIKFKKRYKKPKKKEPKGNIHKIAEIKRKEEAKANEIKEMRYEILENIVEDDYEIENYEDFELISDGRFADSPVLVYNEIFTVKNLITKAGKNYMINIGKFIGSQLELDEEDMKRHSNININYPKSYIYNIKLQIPDGYIIEGVDQLNINVSSDVGEFISTATVEGSYLIVNTNKSYKIYTAEKEEWSKYIEFIEAAYNFTKKKVVLKKM